MPHYFDQEQDSPLRPTKISFISRERTFSATTWSGTFSRDKLDRGTEVLLKYSVIPPDGRILDLGCGWGAVTLVVKSCFPAVDMIAVDVNERAVKNTRHNLTNNNLTGVLVKKSDGFEKLEGNFDCILTNPPYAAGRKVCFKLIEDSLERLNKDGSLQLVARHKKGGAMLDAHMEEVFGNVETLAKKGGFRVYKSIKK